ncbi:MAG: ATP-binding cassette domain-containing protein, partial [Pseudomonadota bacterium]
LVMLYISVVWLNMATITLGLFLIIIVRLLPIARDFVKARQIISSTISSVEVIYDRLRALKVHAELDDGSQVLDNIENNIQFAKVSFKYDGTDTVVLKDISIEIPAGKTTAIIGPSGAGKSTLIDLLPRLRKPSAGTIYFDGQDLADIRLASLRRNISYVPQEPQIFDASIADHIRLGKTNAAMDEIRDAARLAGATQFIEALPHGYETVVGERGGRLSGGQRQRLDLARAIVRKAPVLIMDEPTSNLDPKSEKDFLNALGQIQRELKPTVIVVAHRLSTIRHADKIIILSNGIVEASGRHEELIEISKWYKDLAVGQA